MIKSPVSRILPLLIALFLLGACGQKGPLYVPGSAEDPATTDQRVVGSDPAGASAADAGEGSGEQEENEQEENKE